MNFKNSSAKSKISWIVATFFAILALIVAILPFIFMVLNSFKERFEMFTNGIFAWPESFYIDNYVEVLTNSFGSYFLNSVIVLIVSLTLLLLFVSAAAYPLSRFDFKLKAIIFSIIIACMSIPVHVTLIPIFKMSNTFGLYDSIWALVGPYVAMSIPIGVFILTTFMKAIPKEIEEAAEIDGCNKYKIFSKIILPMAKPGLSTIAIYSGVAMWNEFIFAYTLTQSPENRTLPLAVWEFQGQYSLNTPMIMATLVLTVLPMIILFIFAQDKLVKGMTAGAVKG